MRRSLGVVLCAAGLSGCYFIVGTSGLQGDPSDPPASPDGGDAALAVADGDVGALDGTGGGDGANGSDGSPASPCAAPHAFCDDFDTGDTDVSKRWDFTRQDFGALAINQTRSVSAPRSLSFVSAAKPGVNETSIEKSVTLMNHQARVELELFVGTESGSFPELDPVGVRLDPPASGYNFNGVYLIFRDGNASAQAFGEGTGGSNYNVSKPLGVVARDRWHHVVVTVNAPASAAPTMTFAVGATSVTLTLPSSSATSIVVGVGALYANAPGGVWSLNFDNVVVDSP